MARDCREPAMPGGSRMFDGLLAFAAMAMLATACLSSQAAAFAVDAESGRAEALASFAGMHDAISVSVAAAFPADATGTICGIWLRREDVNAACAAQAEYLGGGVFAIRYDGFSLDGRPQEVGAPCPQVVPRIFGVGGHAAVHARHDNEPPIVRLESRARRSSAILV